MPSSKTMPNPFPLSVGEATAWTGSDPGPSPYDERDEEPEEMTCERCQSAPIYEDGVCWNCWHELEHEDDEEM